MQVLNDLKGNLDSIEQEAASKDVLLFCDLVLQKWGCLESAVAEMKINNYERAIQILKEEWNSNEPLFVEDLQIPEELPGVDVLYGAKEVKCNLLALCYAKLGFNDLAVEELLNLCPESERGEVGRVTVEQWLSIVLDNLPEFLDAIEQQAAENARILNS